jgi:hypothetical protein
MYTLIDKSDRVDIVLNGQFVQSELKSNLVLRRNTLSEELSLLRVSGYSECIVAQWPFDSIQQINDILNPDPKNLDPMGIGQAVLFNLGGTIPEVLDQNATKVALYGLSIFNPGITPIYLMIVQGGIDIGSSEQAIPFVVNGKQTYTLPCSSVPIAYFGDAVYLGISTDGSQ